MYYFVYALSSLVMFFIISIKNSRSNWRMGHNKAILKSEITAGDSWGWVWQVIREGGTGFLRCHLKNYWN